MCIIVAKNAGVKMPSTEIITNCFNGNPDGAGIMLCAKGRVYGFKGLMTLDSVLSKLKDLEKRFGSLTKLPVVMHFRIGTHGANIAGNTHPFPVAGNYKALRKLEWQSDLGMAHNGIISITSKHADVKKENVSDTMVFIKRMVAPIAARTNIMNDPKILESLRIASGSKLCFLDNKARLITLGDFNVSEGVYYSNYSWEGKKLFSFSKYYSAYDWDEYDIPVSTTSTKYKKKYEYIPKLSKDEEKSYREEMAEDWGLTELGRGWKVVCNGYEVPLDAWNYAVDEVDGTLYYWDENDYIWCVSSWDDEYIELAPADVEVDVDA